MPRSAHAGHAQLEPAHVEHVEGDVVPLPASPSRFSAGTLQSCRSAGRWTSRECPACALPRPRSGPACRAQSGTPRTSPRRSWQRPCRGPAMPQLVIHVLLAVENVVLAVGRKRGARADVHGVRARSWPQKARRLRSTRRSPASAGSAASAPPSRTRPAAACRCPYARQMAVEKLASTERWSAISDELILSSPMPPYSSGISTA